MSLRKNIAANSLGMIATTLAYIFSLPIYLHIYGQDRFGLIAIFFTLVAVSALLDFGFGFHLGRVLNIRQAQGAATNELVAALIAHERWVLPMCLLVGTLLWFLLPAVLPLWISSNSIPVDLILNTSGWIGFCLALQMPLALYMQALLGLRYQVEMNIVNVLFTIIRLYGVILLNFFLDFDFKYFFIWNFLVLAIQALVLASYLRYRLPIFSTEVLRERLDFTSVKFIVTSAITLASAVLLTHLDKLILSSLVELRTFGYYSLSWSIASLLIRLTTPLSNSTLPALIACIATNDKLGLRTLYFRTLKWSVTLTTTVAVFLFVYAHYILLIYTGSAAIADEALRSFRGLIVGSALNAIVVIMFTLATAHGWMHKSMWANLLACLISVPIVYYATNIWGMPGAAYGWIAVNLSLLLVGYFMVHKVVFKPNKTED